MNSSISHQVEDEEIKEYINILLFPHLQLDVQLDLVYRELYKTIDF